MCLWEGIHAKLLHFHFPLMHFLSSILHQCQQQWPKSETSVQHCVKAGLSGGHSSALIFMSLQGSHSSHRSLSNELQISSFHVWLLFSSSGSSTCSLRWKWRLLTVKELRRKPASPRWVMLPRCRVPLQNPGCSVHQSVRGVCVWGCFWKSVCFIHGLGVVLG